jgi:hypothetical protein
MYSLLTFSVIQGLLPCDVTCSLISSYEIYWAAAFVQYTCLVYIGDKNHNSSCFLHHSRDVHFAMLKLRLGLWFLIMVGST